MLSEVLQNLTALVLLGRPRANAIGTLLKHRPSRARSGQLDTELKRAAVCRLNNFVRGPADWFTSGYIDTITPAYPIGTALVPSRNLLSCKPDRS